MLRIILAATAALFLVACGPANKVADFVSVATKTIVNPVSAVDIYRIKNVYAATLEAFDGYRSYCWARSFKSLMADPIAKPICQARRAVVRTVQAARPKVRRSIDVAENFVRDNPTLSATTVITAAWKSVNDFRALVPVAK